MGKRARRLRREAARATSTPTVTSNNNSNNNNSPNGVDGGIIGAMHRNRNGQATPKDIDFLIRMGMESRGRDGYTGESKTTSSSTFTSYTPNPTIRTYKGDDHVFHCAEASEITSKCPLNPVVPCILVPITMWECFLACCKEYDTEWIALLIGKEGKDHKDQPAYIIERFYFPPQNASGAHVDVPTGVKPKPGTIGAIHSHVDMGVFWSHTDTSHSNWPVEIVINRKEEYEALSRYKLKCGEWAKGKSEVRLTGAYVSATINKQVQDAFTLGGLLAKKVATVTSTSNIPSGVHPDDRDDVKEAMIKYPNTSSPTTRWGKVPCKACNHYSHTLGTKCSALDCKCETFVGDSGPDVIDIGEGEVCPNPICVRPKDHPGYHRTKAGDYFQYKTSKEEDSQGKIKWPLPSTSTITSSTTTNSSIIPAKDDPTITGDLPSEEYCLTCEGYGLVEEGVGSGIAIPCSECKGTGLSEVGKVRAAESMLN